MRISRAATYAILASVQLSDSNASPPVPCSQLAQLGDMPERFLLQVLRSLVNEGILKSTRGVDGGYRLARPLSQITLLEIVEAIDGPVQPELPHISGLTPQSERRLAEALGDIAEDAKRRLAEVTLAQLKPIQPMANNLAKARRTG
ncbi:MAG: Rrf2 family transcriptional regulator [Pirellulales bacterium]|nr:Rrf2 family transcriptional regulator [Pirellulales bacterium]